MEKATKEEKAAIMQAFKDAEQRAMIKIKNRMRILAKSERLRKQMERQIKEELSPKPKDI
jgi:hypothetical protein